MNKTMTIAVIALVAVVMGMSATVPAFAGGPPSNPAADPHPPEIDCADLEEKLAASNASDVAKDKIRELAGCNV